MITTGLVLVWAMPPVVSVNIWTWMVDYEFGVANWVLSHLGLEYFDHHDWFVSPWEGFAVITAIIVWGAIPFVAITLYAGLTQVPRELVEAASIDGSNAFQIFRDITLPILKPIFVILDEPLGDLELPGVQPDLDHPERAARVRVLPDGDLLVRHLVQRLELRARLGDRARDGAGRCSR